MPDMAPEPTRTRFGLVFLLWFAGLCAAGQFAKISTVFAELQSTYGGAGAWSGFLVSILSLTGIVLGLAAGQTVARAGFRRLLIGALLLGAAMSAWQAVLPPFSLMLASRLLEGLSHLAIVVAAPTLIAQVSTSRHRPVTMTLWGTFFGVAFAVFAWLGAPLAREFGIASLFLAHAAAMVTVAMVLYLRLPPHIAPREATSPPGLRQLAQLHRAIYASPWIGAPAIGWLFYTLTFVSLLTLLPPFIDASIRDQVTALLPLAGIVSSLTIGVYLLRHFAAVQIVMAGFVIAAMLALLLAVLPGNAGLSIALFAALGLIQGASFASVPQLNSTAADQAKANGAIAQMGNLGNTCGTPLLLAAIGMGGFGLLMGLAALCYLAGLGLHLHAARRRNRIQR